jgi:hypothetical protein
MNIFFSKCKFVIFNFYFLNRGFNQNDCNFIKDLVFYILYILGDLLFWKREKMALSYSLSVET